MSEAGAELLLEWAQLKSYAGDHDNSLELPTRPLDVSTSAGPLRLALGSGGEVRLLVPVQMRTRVPRNLGTQGIHVTETTLHSSSGPVRFLDLTCVDRGREKSFAGVVADIVPRIAEGTGSVAAVQSAIEDFRKLLRGQHAPEKSLSVVIGLLGELLTLQALIEVDRTAHDTWMTGAPARHDFARRNNAIEAKCGLRRHERRVEISSLDQLEEPENGSLLLFHHILEETSKGPVCVSGVAQRLLNSCSDPEELRASLLAKEFDPECPAPWDTRQFIVKEQTLYRVQEGFPRLIAQMLATQLSDGVSHVKYTSNLDVAQGFRVPDDVIRQHLEGFLAR